MKTVKLGNSDLSIAQIGLGTMGMSEFYGASEDDASVKTIHHAIEMGVNFFDTADMYGPFHNERLLGSAIKGHRDSLVIATKFGIMRNEADRAFLGINGSPEYIKKACEDSLKRLDIDTIDLYYMHRKDPNVPIEDTVGAMSELVQAGKVRYLGLSEVSGATLKRAHAVHPIAAVQSEYSLWSTDIEEAVLPECRELNVALVAYSPLGRGFLTGQIKRFEDLAADDYRRSSPRFLGDHFQKNLEIVAEVEAIAAARQVKASQIALAWLLTKGDDIVPIPGTRRIAYLEENIEAASLLLSAEEIARLDQLSAAVAGTRYPEGGMKLINS